MQVQERNWIMTEYFFPENKEMILRAKPVVTRSRRAFCRILRKDIQMLSCKYMQSQI